MSEPAVTLQELARRLHVSKATISLALRGRPGVSDALRTSIVEEARRSGYTPNPVAAQLMAMVQSPRPPSGGDTIAFINTFHDPSLFRQTWGFMNFVDGARAHAARFGYTVELFDAHAKNTTPKRLARHLKARGVRGILLGPRWRTEPALSLPWQDFSTVLVGETQSERKLYRVCNNHTRSCAVALQALAERGYRRIGVALLRDDEFNRGHDYLLGVGQFLNSGPTDVVVVPWVYDELCETNIQEWIARNELDAVVSLQKMMEVVQPCLTRAGVPVAYASLSVPPGSPCSGINQRYERIGAEAVGLLRNLLLSGERGEASFHRVLLVEGEWVDGTTTAPSRIDGVSSEAVGRKV